MDDAIITGSVNDKGTMFTFTLNSDAVYVDVIDGSWSYPIPSSNKIYNINFSGSESLVSLDLSNLDTSNIYDFSDMFRGCRSLETLNLKGFNTSNAYYMDDMFNGCEKLAELDISSFDTLKCSHMMRMFKNCKSLSSIDISMFKFGNISPNLVEMFKGCDDITISISNIKSAIDMRNINFYEDFIENKPSVTVNYSSNVMVYNHFILDAFRNAKWVDVG